MPTKESHSNSRQLFPDLHLKELLHTIEDQVIQLSLSIPNQRAIVHRDKTEYEKLCLSLCQRYWDPMCSEMPSDCACATVSEAFHRGSEAFFLYNLIWTNKDIQQKLI